MYSAMSSTQDGAMKPRREVVSGQGEARDAGCEEGNETKSLML